MSSTSVIIPCYNDEEFVGRAIQSVLNQEHPNIELVVVDDGSTDKSWDVIQSFDEEITAIRQPNRGGSHARNEGVRAASGDTLLFLDSDDQLSSPHTLAALRTALETEGKGIAGCFWKKLQWSGREWQVTPSGKSFYPPDRDYIRGWLSGWFIPPGGLLWTRDAFQQVGGWDEKLHANQDGDIILRALLQGIPLHRTTQGELLYRVYDNLDHTSVSKKNTRGALLSRARVMERVARRLEKQNRLSRYKTLIGRELHCIAKRGFNVPGELDASYRERVEEIARLARTLAGREAIVGSIWHRIGCSILGLRKKERIANALAKRGLGRQKRREGFQ